MAQTILSNKKSTGSSPYAYYSVFVTPSERTTSSVDIKISIISRLSASESYLGTGINYGLIGYIKINDEEHQINIKATNVSWSGTTKHTTSITKTIENIEATETSLNGIKFRVTRTGSANDGDYTDGAELSSTSCNNIEIEAGHTPPTNVTYTMEETNQKVIDAGISENSIVANMSIKKIVVNGTLHDGATPRRTIIYNGQLSANVLATTLPKEMIFDFEQVQVQNANGKIENGINYAPIRSAIQDSYGSFGFSNNGEDDYYNLIQYNKPTINEANTSVKRNGQTSGKVKLNFNGTYFNGIVGNKDQTGAYKPTIKYKFWKYGENEPSIYDYTIPSENVDITNNNVSVNNYEIGSIVETDINYFNPDFAYRVKVQIEDNFYSLESQEKSIPIGEATWTEYKDRVDFKKITIKNKEIEQHLLEKRVNVTINNLPTGSSYECYYIPFMKMCFVTLYVTGKSFTANTSHVIGNIADHLPNRRYALSVYGLQDYAGVLKASVTSDGEIQFLTSVAKESGDDQYITGCWFVE